MSAVFTIGDADFDDLDEDEVREHYWHLQLWLWSNCRRKMGIYNKNINYSFKNGEIINLVL
jgi:hypothetical protein